MGLECFASCSPPLLSARCCYADCQSPNQLCPAAHTHFLFSANVLPSQPGYRTPSSAGKRRWTTGTMSSANQMRQKSRKAYGTHLFLFAQSERSSASIQRIGMPERIVGANAGDRGPRSQHQRRRKANAGSLECATNSLDIIGIRAFFALFQSPAYS